MKAILLAGGKGTRLRPLTLHTPKPIVPVFGRAFLNYQIDLVRTVPEIDEVILSLNYQPRRIQDVFGDGRDAGIKISYVVEPSPLGTGGAIKYATGAYPGTVVVFNGDVEISWPAWAGNYVLEHAPTVTGSPDRWDDVSPATYQTDGTRFYITLPAPSDMQFYRLRQVCEVLPGQHRHPRDHSGCPETGGQR